MMAFIRSGVLHKLFLVTSFLSPYASPGKEYVHLYFSFILLTIQNQEKGENTLFCVFLLTQLAMFGGGTVLPKKASLSQKVSASA